MPRSSGVYIPPAGTKGVPNTTIQSAPYNAFVDDLTADANAPRPVTAGGTGASNATTARTNLDVYSKAENDAALTTLGDAKLDKAGGTMTGPLTTTLVRTLRQGGVEGGQIDFERPESETSFTSDVSVDVLRDQVRIFGAHGGTTKQFIVDFASMTGAHVAWHSGNFDPSTKANRAGDTFTGTIQAPRVEFGTASFHARMANPTTPVFDFDTNDYYAYERANNFHQFVIGGVERLRVGAGGVDLLGGGIFGANISAGLLTSGTVADARLPGSLSRKVFTTAAVGLGGGFGNAALEIVNSGGQGAFLTFHRAGSFAANLGVDLDNQLRYGGNGGATYIVWHSGNFNPDTKANTGTVGRGANLIESAALRLDQDGAVDLADPYFMVGARCAIISGVSHLVLRALTGVK